MRAAILAVAVAAASVSAQAPARDRPAEPTGTGIVRGRVFAADSGAGLRRALVRLTPMATTTLTEMPVVLTDAEGRFEFSDLAAGRYTLTASKAGYVMLSYGQRRPGESGRAIDVTNGQTLERIDVSLPRGGVIVARITDSFGAPIPGILVMAEQYRFNAGERRLTPVAREVSSGLGAGTDEAGEMRLHGLLPGEYYVHTRLTFPPDVERPPQAANGLTEVPTYYPGVLTDKEAQRVSVSMGQETAVTFALVPVKPARISGTVRGSDGAVPRQATVALQYAVSSFMGTRNLPLQPDGSFSIANQLPGDYTVVVIPNANDPAAPREYAYVPFTVAGQDISLNVTTMKGATFGGRVVFDTGKPPADLRPGAFRVIPQYVPRRLTLPVQMPTLNPDWTFEIAGLFTAATFTLNPPPAGWYLKEIRAAGRDITDVPLDLSGDREMRDVQVILTQKRGEISGGAVDATGVQIREYAVVVFPEDRQKWTPLSRFIGTARPDQRGRFRITGLPPGNYLVAAMDYLESGSERDPDVLSRLVQQASRVTLADGDSKAVSLRVP